MNSSDGLLVRHLEGSHRPFSYNVTGGSPVVKKFFLFFFVLAGSDHRPLDPYNVTGCGDPASGFLSLIVTAADEFPAVGTIDKELTSSEAELCGLIELDVKSTPVAIPHSMFDHKPNCVHLMRCLTSDPIVMRSIFYPFTCGRSSCPTFRLRSAWSDEGKNPSFRTSTNLATSRTNLISRIFPKEALTSGTESLVVPVQNGGDLQSIAKTLRVIRVEDNRELGSHSLSLLPP